MKFVKLLLWVISKLSTKSQIIICEVLLYKNRLNKTQVSTYGPWGKGYDFSSLSAWEMATADEGANILECEHEDD